MTRESTQTGVWGSILRQMISLKIYSSRLPSRSIFTARPNSRTVPNPFPKDARHHSVTLPHFSPAFASKNEARTKIRPPTSATIQQLRPLTCASSDGRNRTAVPKESSNNSTCSCLREIFPFSANTSFTLLSFSGADKNRSAFSFYTGQTENAVLPVHIVIDRRGTIGIQIRDAIGSQPCQMGQQ